MGIESSAAAFTDATLFGEVSSIATERAMNVFTHTLLLNKLNAWLVIAKPPRTISNSNSIAHILSMRQLQPDNAGNN